MTEYVKCPICGSETIIRKATKGPKAGRRFHVCNRYPDCTGRVQVYSSSSQENERLIYQQDCESFRYQDKLFYTRFQLIWVLESAVTGVLFFTDISHGLALALSIFTALVVFAIVILAAKDYRDSKLFIVRIHNYEQKVGVEDIIPRKVLKIFDGKIIGYFLIGITCFYNIFLIICAYYGW